VVRTRGVNRAALLERGAWEVWGWQVSVPFWRRMSASLLAGSWVLVERGEAGAGGVQWEDKRRWDSCLPLPVPKLLCTGAPLRARAHDMVRALE